MHYISINNGLGYNLQYDPYYDQSDMITANASKTTDERQTDGTTSKTIEQDVSSTFSLVVFYKQ